MGAAAPAGGTDPANTAHTPATAVAPKDRATAKPSPKAAVTWLEQGTTALATREVDPVEFADARSALELAKLAGSGQATVADAEAWLADHAK